MIRARDRQTERQRGLEIERAERSRSVHIHGLMGACPQVVKRLLLPAVSAYNMRIAAAEGRQVMGHDAALIMKRAFLINGSSLPMPSAHAQRFVPKPTSQPMWEGVTVAGDKGVRIDAAYFANPAQATTPPLERKWIVYDQGLTPPLCLTFPLFRFSVHSSRLIACCLS